MGDMADYLNECIENDYENYVESDIPKIRELRNDGLSLQKIANIYSVSKKTILNIIHRKVWVRF